MGRFRPALTKLAVTSPQVLRPFLSYNESRPAREQIRPYNFLLHAQVAPFGHPLGVNATRFRLIAPYERDATRWDEINWFDLYTGNPYAVTTTGDPSPVAVRVKNYRDILGLYASNPEPKSLGPDGKPCGRASTGLLQRRPVTVTTIDLIGKESNRVEDTTAGLIGELGDILACYQDPQLDPWQTLVLPVLQDHPTKTVAALTGLDPRTVQRLRNGQTTPHRHHRAGLALAAAKLAATRLDQHSLTAPDELQPCLATYRDHRETLTTRSCQVCGERLTSSRALFCSPACKKRAYRERSRARRSAS